MKQKYAKDLVEDLMTMHKPQIVIEVNGHLIPTKNYYHSEDKKGNMVIVITTGKGS